VKGPFPVVGVIGAGSLPRLMIAPAIALGIELFFLAERSNSQACTVLTFVDSVPASVIRVLEEEGFAVRPGSHAIESVNRVNEGLNHVCHDDDLQIAVTVARSPHGQACAWTPTLILRTPGNLYSTQTPVPSLTENRVIDAQKIALEVAAEVGAVGVMTIEICIRADELLVNKLTLGPHEFGYWTIDGSRTSQFEQHLRAILDLPLGDPSMTTRYAVTGNFLGGLQSDMYRPYLHLMARTPALKFHQYREDVREGDSLGHVTAVGDHLLDLVECVSHAVNYMSGVIDE